MKPISSTAIGLFGVLRGFLFFLPRNAAESAPPRIIKVTTCKRTENDSILDIYYTLINAEKHPCAVNIIVFDDKGNAWDSVPLSTALSGDVGVQSRSGKKHIMWNKALSVAQGIQGNCRVMVIADTIGPGGLVWVTVNNPAFAGQICKHEVTNAQYCAFLNTALAADNIVVESNYVRGARGSNSKGGFEGRDYYNLEGVGWPASAAIKKGAARITYSGYSFSVMDIFKNHPVNYVSWYGAMAFCNYYGYRLPTALEWQSVAAYDGTHKYGCGTTIDNRLANYRDSAHPHGTTPVSQFGAYGYGLADLAGNVWEWTSTVGDDECRVLHGGSWLHWSFHCSVGMEFNLTPDKMGCHTGFRVWR